MVPTPSCPSDLFFSALLGATMLDCVQELGRPPGTSCSDVVSCAFEKLFLTMGRGIYQSGGISYGEGLKAMKRKTTFLVSGTAVEGAEAPLKDCCVCPNKEEAACSVAWRFPAESNRSCHVPTWQVSSGGIMLLPWGKNERSG